MIWVIGGTKDSRDFIESFPLKKNLIVSTATEYGGKLLEEIKDIKIISQRMDMEQMKYFIDENKIEKVIDLSHPYAVDVSKNAIEVCRIKKIEYIRFEREQIDTPKDVIEFSNIDKMIEYIESLNKNILITLGSNNIEKFKNLKNLKHIYFRILPKWEMIKKTEDMGILSKNIIGMQGPFTKELNIAMMKQLNIEYIVSKKGGDTGGEREKIESAKEIGVKSIFLTRPKIDYPKIFFNIEEIFKYLNENN